MFLQIMIVMQIKKQDALALWQAKAKGHLNRYKAYPEEAKRKGRTGAPKCVLLLMDKVMCHSLRID